VDAEAPRRRTPALLGSVEPHAPLLNVPPDGQLLYKIMKVEDLLRSIAGEYLHFSRVCDYKDFPRADPHDGEQYPQDRQRNATSVFQKTQDFSAANYYDQARARTYACCFSLKNSPYIWESYGNNSKKGKVCIVFEFGKLHARLNRLWQRWNSVLMFNGARCHQIFSINYGIVEYVQWDIFQTDAERLPNPIKYTYSKDRKYSDDKELRISLSALGIGRFVLSDATIVDFPSNLSVAFDFRAAMAEGIIPKILCSQDCDAGFLLDGFHKLRIVPSEGSRRLLPNDQLRERT
jgi:hypothetical protein